MNVYLFAVGAIDPIKHRKDAKQAVEFIKTLPGFVAIHPNLDYSLLCFDTLDNAIISRGKWTETGNDAARYIMEATIEKGKGLLTVKGPAWDSQGGQVQ